MDFDSVRRRYTAWRLLYISGEISLEEFERRLDSLTGEDAQGRRWRIDPETGHWLRREGDRWIRDDPEQAAEPASSPPTPDEALPPPSPPPSEGRPGLAAWLRDNWGWAAVMGAGVLLLAASIFLLASLILVPTTPSTADEGAGVASEVPGPTAAPFDINTPPTATLEPTVLPPTVPQEEGHQMVLVPGGTFRMGTTAEEMARVYAICNPILGEAECRTLGFESEQPAHDVMLDAYYIDVYEVTNAQLAAFLTEMDNRVGGGVPWLEAGDESVRLQRAADGTWQPIPGYADHPATEITWFGAQAFCEWRGGRLPTEAEWEMAARWNPETNAVTVYPWGDQEPDSSRANFGIIGTGTRPVGSFEAGRSPLGLYDMSGNVFEWVADWFAPTYEGAATVNPLGPESGEKKVIRGGSWGDNAFFLRAANRGSLAPTAALNFVGFRCVKPVSAVTP